MNKLKMILSLLRFWCCHLRYRFKLEKGPRNYFNRGNLDMKQNSKFIMGSHNVFGTNFDFEIQGEFKLGSRNYFNKNVKIVCFDKIEIGDDCLFADSVHVYDHDHRFDRLDLPIRDQGYNTAPVKIGNNVWLGAKVTVLKGVTIADGVVVGANSVVTTDLPSHSICAGIPAKVIKMRG